MKSFEFFKTIANLPLAIWHVLKTHLKLRKDKNIIFEIRNAQNLKYQNNKPKTHVVISYFWATKIFPNIQCLPRSLALFQKLQKSGCDVEHKIGAHSNSIGTGFHAWVEFKGIPLNESQDSIKKFKELKKYEHFNLS